jgi:hypothetical protein
MSDVLLARRLQHQGISRVLVVFNGSEADQRALETGLELASCTRASLRGILFEGEFRHYSMSHDELERSRTARRERFALHAFRLGDCALERAVQLPLDLVGGDGRSWLRGWLHDNAFELVVVAYEHRMFGAYLPTSLVARVRRSASCPVVVVK